MQTRRLEIAEQRKKDFIASEIFAKSHGGRTAPTGAEINTLREKALKNAYERLKKHKLGKAQKQGAADFRTEFHNLKADAKNEALQRAETAQLLWGLRNKNLVAHGRGSNLFIEKTPKIKALQRATSRGALGEGTSYLKEMGIYGIIGHSFVRFFAARPYVKAKTKAVASALEMVAAAKSKNFRRFVFATTRFVYDNHRNRGTAIYDQLAEGIIYDVFGKLARKNKDFAKIYNVNGEPSNVGKQFFRYLINENILKNFKSVKTMHGKQDFEIKMDAIRYCTVGDRIDSREKNYARTLDFVHDIFQPGNEVSTLDTYKRMGEKSEAHHMVFNNALQALISLQYKAKTIHRIEPSEIQSYFRKVCNYYSIKEEGVHKYAFDLFYSMGSPTPGDFSNPLRKRLFEVKEMIKEVYRPLDIPMGRKKGGKKRENKRADATATGIQVGFND